MASADARAQFIPVLWGAYDREAAAYRDPADHTLTWWQDTDYFKHGWFLTSPMTQWGMPAIKRALSVPRDHRILYDSGGYMKIGGSFNASASNVSKWYNTTAERGDVAMILDVPPVKRVTKQVRQEDGTMKAVREHGTLAQVTNEEFEAALEETVANAEVMLSHKGDYSLFGVIQGRNFAEMNRWAQRLQRLGEFDGWALSPKTHLTKLIGGLVIARHYFPGKPVHILGWSGARAFVSAAYMSHWNGARVTTDSSTPIQYGKKHQYMLPGGLDTIPMNKAVAPSRLPCLCPVCAETGPEGLCGDIVAGNLSSTRNALHNLFTMNAFVDIVNSVRHNPEALMTVAPKDLKGLFSALQFYDERGLEAFSKRADFIRTDFDRRQRSLIEFGVTTDAPCKLCLHRPGITPYGEEELMVCETCYDKLVSRDEALGLMEIRS
jgi:tRNA-guanine family transglycosylase